MGRTFVRLFSIFSIQIPYNNGRVVLGAGADVRGQRLEVEGEGQSQGQGQTSVLRSRVDDIALQLVYSDNRLSHLETQMLNATLSACQRSNNDMQQVRNTVLYCCSPFAK
jgi:hypothetical protein